MTPISGSIFGNATQLEATIPAMANHFRDILNDWATQYGGRCFVAEDDQEKINIGFNNCVGPRVLLVFTGEAPYLDQSISDHVPYERRTWDIIIQRGKILSDPRNSSLTSTTGPSKAFYTLMEECRDVIRRIQLPSGVCYNPLTYLGTRPAEQSGWLMDSYIISIETLVQIPRIQYNPLDPAFANLSPPGDWLPNSPP